MKAATLTDLFHSRALAGVLALCAVVAAWFWFAGGYTVPVVGDRGFALPSANEWLPAGWLNFAACIAVTALTVLFTAMMNKIHNVLRGMTGLYISLFAVMEMSVPDFMTQLYTGPVLALTATVALMLLFDCYKSPAASGHVFLVFLMFSLLAATQYCFALYVPVFLIICAQMRALNMKTLIAAGLGVITPWWMLIGFGIVSLSDIHLPDFRTIFATMDFGDQAATLVSVGFTALLLILSVVLNIFKAIAYNARSRAVNGSITVAGLFTVLGACLDFSNIPAYVPLLNMLAAVQTAHYFTTHRWPRTWIPLALIILVYIVLYVCQILMSTL